jgi:DNA-binding CsgD family transcriptional regulator
VTSPSLFGRQRERRLLNDLVDHAQERGGALVLRGDAGIGKSALLAVARSDATDQGFGVLTATGVLSEAHIPFAGLHQLLQPILSRVDELLAAQRDRVLAAFGVTETKVADVSLIALATLDLLGDVAAHSPLLLLVEDAQWLDQPTCDVLAFVARRLESEPIVLLIAIRQGYESSFARAGLRELRVEGLDEAAAGALLDAHAPHLSPGVRKQVLDEARGNPLALLELPAAPGTHRRGEPELPVRLALTSRLETAFAARSFELPVATQRLLLVAAVDDGDGLPEMLAATAIIGPDTQPVAALESAIAAGLLVVDNTTLRFRHPLVRSAIQQAASISARQEAHAALAEVLTAQPDRRTWHRAASIIGPNEEIASELEAIADGAQRRGATAVAVVALERAATLSEAPSRSARRLLRTVELAFELGRRDLVARLLPEIGPLELGTRERARLTWLREMFQEDFSGGATRIRALVGFGERMSLDGDTHHALQFLRMAALRCLLGDEDKETRDLVVAATERLQVPDDDPELIDILSRAAPVERGAAIISRLSQLDPKESGDPEVMRLLGMAGTAVGAFDLSRGYLTAAVAGLRSEGRLASLAPALVSQAYAAIFTGDWNLAGPTAAEARRLARETAQPFWAAGAQVAEAMVAALRGQSDEADALLAEAERVTLPMGVRVTLAVLQLARGLTALARGRHADAYDELYRIFRAGDPAYHSMVRRWAIGDLAEAAVHTGHREEARVEVGKLESLAEVTPAGVLHAGLHYARPLLADDADAEKLFQAALSTDLSSWPFARARVLLAYGIWLRRQRRVAESRTPLRAARDAFDALGAVPWGERARQELRASGETSRRRLPQAWDLLSPQELQIARMAASGLSNREIGQQLYLSHRTIGSHLYRIFPKLGITSRSQLRATLEHGSASPA